MLAPWAMKSKDSSGRAHDEGETTYRGATRGIYQRDRDRVIHCAAFRRLEYKTQVFVSHEGDNYRTRLTHTLEVAQIARGIARALRLNEDLTEAVALAHDLGHTPFGHSGEDVLHELMAGHGGFEHNTHGLRIVDRLENRYPNFPGLNLTHEVRECIAKHSTRHDNPAATEFDPERQALLEGQAVDAADEIAFNNHDVDDGVRAGIIKPEQLDELELWREAAGRADEAFRDLDSAVRPTQVITFLIHILTIDLLESSVERIRAAGVGSAADVQACGQRLIGFSDGVQAKKRELENFLLEDLYRHARVQRMADKATRCIAGLFHEYVRDPGLLSPNGRAKVQDEIGRGLPEEDALHRVVCDYIAGMTDRFAQEEYKRLFHPSERV
ncbi:MAG: deoxyguanosinetriphosphate triphosphohydrolase [Planctomycetota bacterium]